MDIQGNACGKYNIFEAAPEMKLDGEGASSRSSPQIWQSSMIWLGIAHVLARPSLQSRDHMREEYRDPLKCCRNLGNDCQRERRMHSCLESDRAI